MDPERLDPDGCIIPEADLDKVQPEYLGVPQAAGEMLLEGSGPRLHSGYVYGSVVRGNAVPGRSDLDLAAVLRAPPTGADRAAAVRVAAVMRERYPVLADVGVGLTHMDELLGAGERYGGQVFLRELSVCICAAPAAARTPAWAHSATAASRSSRSRNRTRAPATAPTGGRYAP